MEPKTVNRISWETTASPSPEVRRGFAPFAPLWLLPMVLFATLSCGDAQNRSELAGRIAAVEGRAEDDARIHELRAEIRAVDNQVEKTIDSVRNKGTYWRLLGLKYMDYAMWGEALKAFDEAVAIYPEHPVLLYNRSLCAGQMALVAADADTRRSFIDSAESGYRRTLALDPRYTPAMYALAVILVFEKDQPDEAVAHLQDFLAIERSDIPARFLLARAYLDTGRDGDALDAYDTIIRSARSAEERNRAEELYRRVAEGGNE